LQNLDEDSNQCKKIYRNTESSTGNLIRHLDEVHKIVSRENEEPKKVNLWFVYLKIKILNY